MTAAGMPTKAGAAELSEKQLDHVSGGHLIVRIWDYRDPGQRETAAQNHESSIDGKSDD